MNAEPVAATRTRVIAAEPRHLEWIARIYAEMVRASPATFDLEPPPADHWQRMLAGVDPPAGHFLLVAVDDADTVLGHAKSGAFAIARPTTPPARPRSTSMARREAEASAAPPTGA